MHWPAIFQYINYPTGMEMTKVTINKITIGQTKCNPSHVKI